MKKVLITALVSSLRPGKLQFSDGELEFNEEGKVEVTEEIADKVRAFNKILEFSDTPEVEEAEVVEESSKETKIETSQMPSHLIPPPIEEVIDETKKEVKSPVAETPVPETSKTPETPAAETSKAPEVTQTPVTSKEIETEEKVEEVETKETSQTNKEVKTEKEVEEAKDAAKVVEDAESELKSQLNDLTVPDLQDLISKAGKEAKEYRDLRKPELIDYIVENKLMD